MSEPKLLPFDEAMALYVEALMETRRQFGCVAPGTEVRKADAVYWCTTTGELTFIEAEQPCETDE